MNGHQLPWVRQASEDEALLRSVKEHDIFVRSTIAPVDSVHRELAAESSGTPPGRGTLSPKEPGVSERVARWLRRSV